MNTHESEDDSHERNVQNKSAGLLIQLAGHAGSGKTTLARILAARMNAVLLDLDTVKSALLDAGVAWDAASRESYPVIYALVTDNLARPGAVVLVDCPSYWAEIHQTLTAAADRVGARYVFLECCAEESTRAKRIAARATRRSQIRTYGEPPIDAPPSSVPAHTRVIARPEERRCIRIDTESAVDIDALLVEFWQ